MKNVTINLLILGLLSSVNLLAQEAKEVKLKEKPGINKTMTRNGVTNTLSCRDAYEKNRGKRYHKRFLRHLFKNKQEKAELKRAVDYAFTIGAYCRDGRLLTNKEFKAQTLQTLKELQAADQKGVKLESLVTGTYQMNCKDLIKMPKTTQEDGHNENIMGMRFLGLKSDIHNIHSAYEQSSNGLKAETKNEKRLAKKKKRYMRRVLKDSIRKLDDDSLTMKDVNLAFESSIKNGDACAGKRVMNKMKMKKDIMDKLDQKSQNNVAVNDSELDQLKKHAQFYFQNGGTITKLVGEDKEVVAN